MNSTFFFDRFRFLRNQNQQDSPCFSPTKKNNKHVIKLASTKNKSPRHVLTVLSCEFKNKKHLKQSVVFFIL